MADMGKSLLETIVDTLPERDKFLITESRGSHAIASAINFINMLKENFPHDQSEDLIKRFINAIRTDDPKKFYRGLKHLSEGGKVNSPDVKE